MQQLAGAAGRCLQQGPGLAWPGLAWLMTPSWCGPHMWLTWGTNSNGCLYFFPLLLLFDWAHRPAGSRLSVLLCSALPCTACSQLLALGFLLPALWLPLGRLPPYPQQPVASSAQQAVPCCLDGSSSAIQLPSAIHLHRTHASRMPHLDPTCRPPHMPFFLKFCNLSACKAA